MKLLIVASVLFVCFSLSAVTVVDIFKVKLGFKFRGRLYGLFPSGRGVSIMIGYREEKT